MTALVAIAAIVALYLTTQTAFQTQRREFRPAPLPDFRPSPDYHVCSDGQRVWVSSEKSGRVLASFHSLDNAQTVAEEIASFGIRRLEKV